MKTNKFIITDAYGNTLETVEDEAYAIEICNNHNYGLIDEFEMIFYEEI